jgi:hypothetical protein
VHLVGFITTIYHGAQSSECQITYTNFTYPHAHHTYVQYIKIIRVLSSYLIQASFNLYISWPEFIPVTNNFIRKCFQRSRRVLYIILGTVNKKEAFLGNYKLLQKSVRFLFKEKRMTSTSMERNNLGCGNMAGVFSFIVWVFWGTSKNNFSLSQRRG